MQDPQAFWNARYADAGFAYGTAPNDFVVEVAARIPEGPVLCLAEGDGPNAVYLTSRGHEVTPAQLELNTGGPRDVGRLVAPEDLREELASLSLEVFETMEREVREGPFHEGKSAVVRALARRV